VGLLEGRNLDPERFADALAKLQAVKGGSIEVQSSDAARRPPSFLRAP
jgi:hypothetical protein